jgi:REP element-mobilizing transposase RayT
MARLARVVLSGYPHHVILLGNRRQDVSFGDDDYNFLSWFIKRMVQYRGY